MSTEEIENVKREISELNNEIKELERENRWIDSYLGIWGQE